MGAKTSSRRHRGATRIDEDDGERPSSRGRYKSKSSSGERRGRRERVKVVSPEARGQTLSPLRSGRHYRPASPPAAGLLSDVSQSSQDSPCRKVTKVITSTPRSSSSTQNDSRGSAGSTRTRRSLEQIVKDLSATSTTMETVSELDSPSKFVLQIPILDAEQEPQAELSQPREAEVAQTSHLRDPSRTDTEPPTLHAAESQTDIHVGPGDILVVVPAGGGRLELTPFDSVRMTIGSTLEEQEPTTSTTTKQ